jgi:hypothetical protein
MACDPLNYTGVGAEQLIAARETISSAYGLHIEQVSGVVSKSGFKLRWNYDAVAQTLEIQCLSKPFVVPCGVVNGRINALAKDCGVQPDSDG